MPAASPASAHAAIGQLREGMEVLLWPLRMSTTADRWLSRPLGDLAFSWCSSSCSLQTLASCSPQGKARTKDGKPLIRFVPVDYPLRVFGAHLGRPSR